MDLFEQEEQRETPVFQFATVAGVHEDGISLIFDGETAAGGKHYRCNTSAVFRAGDRVKICQDSGTYVVEYAVGAPQGASSGSLVPEGGQNDLNAVLICGENGPAWGVKLMIENGHLQFYLDGGQSGSWIQLANEGDIPSSGEEEEENA